MNNQVDGFKREKQEREIELQDLQDILSTDAGIRFMRRVLEKCGCWQNPMTGNSTTFFNCGKMDIGLFLTDEIIEANESAYLKILTLNKGKENE